MLDSAPVTLGGICSGEVLDPAQLKLKQRQGSCEVLDSAPVKPGENMIRGSDGSGPSKTETTTGFVKTCSGEVLDPAQIKLKQRQGSCEVLDSAPVKLGEDMLSGSVGSGISKTETTTGFVCNCWIRPERNFRTCPLLEKFHVSSNFAQLYILQYSIG